MRDDINRVKGEQGKPTFSPGSLSPSSDISSEHERTSGHREPPRRGPKKETLRIDRTEGCQLAPTVLPPEAELKGDERVVIQDVRVETDNIAFQKEAYSSPSQKQTSRAELPPGYTGEFGPRSKPVVVLMKNAGTLSAPPILEFFTNQGLHISAGSISNLLLKHHDVFPQENDEIVRAGLASSGYPQIAETSARVKGHNQHTQIVCHSLYTAGLTTETKSRLSAIQALQNGIRPRVFDPPRR